MSGYQDELRELARATGLRARELSAGLEAEGVPWPEHVRGVSSVIGSGNLQAMRLSELEVMRVDALNPAVRSGVVTGAGGQAEAARWTDMARLEQAVATILQSRKPETNGSRIERLGRAEVVETGQASMHDALQTTEGVEGWTRDLEPGACEMCQWWAREGRVWPKAHPMPKHKGCECTQELVVADKGTIVETERTKRMARDRAREQGYESEWK